jgi:hypothetical protein
MSADVNVSFGATTGAFDAGINKIRSSLGSLQGSTNQLGGTFSKLASSFSGIFTGGSANALGSLSSAMGGLASGAQGAAAALGPVGIAIGAIGALSVVTTGALLSMAEQFGDMSEKIDQTSQKLGMATADVMRFNAVGQMAGISNQSMSMSLVRLEKAMASAASGSKKASGAFQQMGVDVNTVKNPTEAVLQIADKFKTMPDGPQKIALAMQTMGRAGSQLIPVLNGGSEALLEQFKMAEEYGVVMDENFIQKGLAIDDAMDRMNMGMDGIRNVLYDSLAPAMQSTVEGINELIKSFITSYKEGGIVKTIMDGVAVTFETLGMIGGTIFSVLRDVVIAFGDTFSAIFDSVSMIFRGTIEEQTEGMGFWEGLLKGILITLQLLATGFRQFGSLVSGIIRGLTVTWVGLAEIIGKALTFDWSGAVASFNVWKSKMVDVAVTMGNDIVSAGQEGYEKVKGIWTKPIKGKFDFGKGTTPNAGDGFDAGAGGSAANSKKKKAADDSKKIAEKALKDSLKALDIEMEAEKDHYDKQIALEEQKLAKIKAFYGEDSNEYKEELNKKEAMVRAHNQKMNALAKAASDHKVAMEEMATDETQAILEDDLANRQAALDHQLAMEEINATQHLALSAQLRDELYAGQIAHEESMWAIKKAAFQDELNLLDLTKEQIDAIHMKMQEAERAHQIKMAEIKRGQGTGRLADQNKGEELGRDNLKKLTDPMVNGFQSAFASILNGQKTFKQAMVGMIQQMVTETVLQLAMIPIKWAANQVVMTLATQLGVAQRLGLTAAGAAAETSISAASNTAQITGAAGVAAAEGAKSQAGIPVVGPALAALAAAGMLALVLGFASMVSAEGGYDVPSSGGGGIDGKGGQMGIFHPNEMILPAKIANPLRSMLAGPQSNSLADSAAAAGASASGGGAMGGDVHYHDHTEKGMSPSQIVANRAALSKAIKMAHREGRFVGAKVLR